MRKYKLFGLILGFYFVGLTQTSYAIKKNIKLCGVLTNQGTLNTSSYYKKLGVNKRFNIVVPENMRRHEVRRYNIVIKNTINIRDRINWWICITGDIHREPDKKLGYGLIVVHDYVSDLTNDEAGLEN